MISRLCLPLFLVLASLYGVPTFAQDARQVAKQVFPSVVVVTTYDSSGRKLSLGSGFFVAENVVTTNFHVVDGATKADIKLIGDNRIYNVSGVVAVNKQRDLVLLQVSGVPGVPLRLANTTKPEV